MNYLLDIGHPAHVHLLKNVANELSIRGHKVFFSVRDVPIAKRLMEIYGMTPYVDLGRKKDTLFGKAQNVISQDWQLLRFVKKNKIDFGLSSGIVLPQVSKFSRMSTFTFDDDDDYVEPLVVKYGHPFSDVTLTPDSITRKTGNAIYYAGTHELAYLHPNHFSPDPRILEKAGIERGDRFFIMRFVAFKGHHDINQCGLSIEQKKRLIQIMEPYGKVIITSERKIEPEFEKYRLPVPPEKIHSLMAYASMFVGDSQTMTSESAILGVPALKCNTFAGRLSVPNELEQKYGLCFSYQPSEFDELCNHVQSLLESLDSTAREWSQKRDAYLADKIDVTAFFTWFIENYPESVRIMNENPDYQYRFK